MSKRYVIQRMRVDTNNNLRLKTDLMNKTLRNLGVKGKINKIDVIDIMSKQPMFMSDREIAELARRKIIVKRRI